MNIVPLKHIQEHFFFFFRLMKESLQLSSDQPKHGATACVSCGWERSGVLGCPLPGSATCFPPVRHSCEPHWCTLLLSPFIPPLFGQTIQEKNEESELAHHFLHGKNAELKDGGRSSKTSSFSGLGSASVHLFHLVPLS